MRDSLKLDIVTPEGIVFSDDANMVGLPALDGQIGILPRHVHLITQIVPGEVTVRTGDRDRYLAVGEGLVEITADHVTVVTDMAVAVEKIDEAQAEEARERAAARLREKISDEEVASVNASLARSLAQLRVRRRHRP
jgi:F-type H+-transporting ATPase subunit epsilon